MDAPTLTVHQDAPAKHPMLQLSSEGLFHFEILAAMSEAGSGGADIGPLLGVAKDVVPGDFKSFGEQFHQLARTTKADAEDPANAYDPLNVRDTWFSAANYFRRADFYLHGNWDDPLINELWEEQAAAFDKALAALPIPGKRVQIASDTFTVEAIWYSAANDNVKRPTMLISNGYDAAQEDSYHLLVAPVLARGWNCITFEGPGQPTVRRNQNLGFIHDWERVVTPVVDYTLSEHASIVDPERLVLFGISFGGYLVARAAAFEPRLAALILNGGVWSGYDAFSGSLPEALRHLHESGNKEKFDELVHGALDSKLLPVGARWGLEHGLWSFKTKSPFEFLEMAKKFTLDGIVGQIKIPVWIADAELEEFFAGHSEKVRDALGDKATLHVFKGVAGYHCQLGATQELVRSTFAWLNKTLGSK